MLVYRAFPSSFLPIVPTSGLIWTCKNNAKYSGLRTLKVLLTSDIPEFKNLIFTEKKVM